MKFLIIDDHSIVRRGLISLLKEQYPNAEFAEAEDAPQGHDMALGNGWDLIIMDINLPGRSGIDLIREVKGAKPDLPVLVVSAHSEKDYGVRALKLGAAGYISKQSAPEVLVAAVHRILSGGRYVSPALAGYLADSLAGTSETTHESLSNRELQVLKLIAQGMTLKEIGVALSLSEKTIATYRARISEKMGLPGIVDLTRYAMRHGLVD